MSNEISYEGLDEAVVLRELYYGTHAVGLGIHKDNINFTVENARTIIERRSGFEPKNPIITFDYVDGRPLKIAFDIKRKVILRPDLYDRDAGPGKCAAIITNLLSVLY